MIPKNESEPQDIYSELEAALLENGFDGKISVDITDRISVSTDNSVYQVLPDMLIKPDNMESAEKALKILSWPAFSHLPLIVRAGGTGTNGQALGKAIILDLGKHLNQVRELNLDEGWVDVDAGIVLANLNSFLEPHGVFFPPTTSTANRCSIGGMIGTDAAGKGSRIYGKTSDHVLALDVMLANGERVWLEPSHIDRLEKGEAGELCKKIYDICMGQRLQIDQVFPKLNRRLSGYDLHTSVNESGNINPIRMICGSEGTLAVVLGARLKLTSIPKFKKLAILAYGDFIDAVASAQNLLEFNPSAVETVDDVIQGKAIEGKLGQLLPDAFQKRKDGSTPICNFVEFTGDDEAALEKSLAELIAFANDKDETVVATHKVTDVSDQAAFWNARKAAVGLLADVPPGPQPCAFVEDCVVPPENLADFLVEFRDLLDVQKTTYGMFGHVDVGCIHVRPAINMHKVGVAKRIRDISDEVQRLARKYDGLLWGEHGKGFRGEYLEETVGSEVYGVMREIKTLFDPHNRLNPGKLAAPLTIENDHIIKIDEAPLRAQRNRVVAEQNRFDDYADAFRCNGNAQCLNSDDKLHMCPSYKATEDLRYSPKGRADLLREWLRLKEKEDPSLLAFEKEMYPVMDGCLSCKACTSSCPIHVDIPELKSRFLASYHKKHMRPLRDYLFARLERLSMWFSHHPIVTNLVMHNPLSKKVSELIGIHDGPRVSSPSIHKLLEPEQAKIWGCEELVEALREGTITHPPGDVLSLSPVVLVDGFNLAYDARAISDIYKGLCKLGFYPFLVYAGASNKAQHVKGFRDQFSSSVTESMERLNVLQELELPVVVAESSYHATLTKDFKALGIEGVEAFQPIPLHDYLLKHLDKIKASKEDVAKSSAKYFPHCTEKTSMPGVSDGWSKILKAVGVDVTPMATGCCGMSGAYGHEGPHQESSQKLYDMTWRGPVEEAGDEAILATGFSCRCQVKRMSERQARHPLGMV